MTNVLVTLDTLTLTGADGDSVYVHVGIIIYTCKWNVKQSIKIIVVALCYYILSPEKKY